MGRTACAEPQCLYKGALYLCLKPYVAYSLDVFDNYTPIRCSSYQHYIPIASRIRIRFDLISLVVFNEGIS